MSLLKNIWYSLPVQLVIVQLKYHQVILLFWLTLFMVISSNLGTSLGVPYLFLAPEYLGSINYFSFAMVGAAFGIFCITWNIAMYIMNSHRFPFMACLNSPFAMFCINNLVLPIFFAITYLALVSHFLLINEFVTLQQLAMNIVGFFTGNAIMILLTALYFQFTNKNIFGLFGLKAKRLQKYRGRGSVKSNVEHTDEEGALTEDRWRVDYFINSKLRVRHVRNVSHYEDTLLNAVFKQNHFNALIAELALLGVLIGLGLMIDYPSFILPTGASVLLLLAMLLTLVGAFSYWLGSWKVTLMLVIVVVVNYFIQYDVFTYKNKAYGLNYLNAPAEYSIDRLIEISSEENIEADKRNTISILENWKAKTGEDRPKMILISTSGGGLSASVFTTRVLQMADSLSGGQLMKNTVLMTGASGGMFGASYYRELYLRQLRGEVFDLYDIEHTYNMGKDILNSVTFTIVVNDIFYPWQRFEMGGQSYRKDRGYMFEKTFHENTGNVLNKKLVEYAQAEAEGIIPMMILTPTIINDERKLYISPHPVSYLMKPEADLGDIPQDKIDGVDFMRFFEDHNPENLNFATAIRMNATYPYVLPNVFLPSSPYMEVMDAGIRDNYGIETTVRFLDIFKEWINENTSGVIVMQIRGFRDMAENIEPYKKQTLIDRLIHPVSNLYSNWSVMQNYSQSYLVSYSEQWFDGKLSHIIFHNIPEDKKKLSAMSLHLTSREKQNIINVLNSGINQRAMNKLQSALSSPGYITSQPAALHSPRE